MAQAQPGSAPDIAGRDIANPVSLLLSVAMLLDDIGKTEAATYLGRQYRRCWQQNLAGHRPRRHARLFRVYRTACSTAEGRIRRERKDGR